MDFLHKPQFTSKENVFDFFNSAIEYRQANKDKSDEIARFVFDATHEATLGIPSDDDIQLIRQEFGALEAPGLPEDNSGPKAYEDKLWQRLRSIIEEKSK